MADADWPLERIQGLLLRGYRQLLVRHFALTVADAVKARALLADLARGGTGGFSITTAAHWGPVTPSCCLNIGFTYRGLEALGVPDASLQIFQESSSAADPNYTSFGAGAKAQASAVLNETGASDPSNWVLSDSDFDMLLSLWVNDEKTLETMTAQLRRVLAGAFDDPPADRIFDTQTLHDGQVYFGYQDGIAQPILKDSPFSRAPDGGQELVDPSAFLIGTGANIYQAMEMNPPVLGRYGCFAAFLILRQDVEAFEAQIAAFAPALGKLLGITDADLQKQALKAAFCGRWPNGTPLAIHPIDGDSPPPLLPPSKINDFLYSDEDGGICPIGAHIRRGNMRLASSDSFPGAPSSRHRILRRAMPYQIPYLPDDRDNPGTERGLAGMFFSASFLYQLELVLGSWINAQFFTDMTMSDPVIGAPDPGDVQMPTPGGDTIGPFKSCVAMKANAYLFYPGMDGIGWIAKQGAKPAHT